MSHFVSPEERRRRQANRDLRDPDIVLRRDGSTYVVRIKRLKKGYDRNIKPSKPKPATNRGSKKPSNAGPRYRSDDSKPELIQLGVLKLLDVNDVPIQTTGYDRISYPTIKRCWDETHKLTRPVLGFHTKYYKIPGTGQRGSQPLIGVRKQRIFGKAVHNTGGPFRMITCTDPSKVQGGGKYDGTDYRPYGYGQRYEGGFVPANWDHGYTISDFSQAGFNGAFDSDYESAMQYGAAAYKRAKPKIAEFDAMQGLLQNVVELPGQLRTTSEGFSKAYKAMSGRRSAVKDLFMPQHVAEQFLNEQFGWAPFVGDMLDLYKAYSRQDKRFKEISQQNGKFNRRSRVLFKTEENSDVTVIDDFAGNCYPTLPYGFYRPNGTFVTSKLYTTVNRRVWGSGSFKFYAPEFDPQNHKVSEGTYGQVIRLLHYYGVNTSPTVVWELTPWTWLVDWFSNAGNVIDNVTSQAYDRLVSAYFYVMCHTTKTAVNETVVHLKDGDVSCKWIQEIESKSRVSASPYGFGLTSGDLSTRQKLILSAIGITHGS